MSRHGSVEQQRVSGSWLDAMSAPAIVLCQALLHHGSLPGDPVHATFHWTQPKQGALCGDPATEVLGGVFLPHLDQRGAPPRHFEIPLPSRPVVGVGSLMTSDLPSGSSFHYLGEQHVAFVEMGDPC